MKSVFALTVLTASAIALPALAVDRPANLGGSMKHVEVAFDGSALSVHVANPEVAQPILKDLLPEGETYSGGFDVLNGTRHNAQYGWLVEAGSILNNPLPADAEFWVELVEQSEGLMTYGAQGTMSISSPIFGTDGSDLDWHWSGSMVHNWYAVDESFIGDTAFATYNVFLGDSQGNALAGYTPGQVTLNFDVAALVPEPAGLMPLAGLALAMLRRRRGA